jgi:hypothetical protein
MEMYAFQLLTQWHTHGIPDIDVGHLFSYEKDYKTEKPLQTRGLQGL